MLKLRFEINNEAHGAITKTWVRYLMQCFTNPTMQDTFSRINIWGPTDFRAYIEYLNEWPLLEYTLRYTRDHDRYSQNEVASPHITPLVRELLENRASYFLGRWMAFRFGESNSTLEFLKDISQCQVGEAKRGQTFLALQPQATAENFQFNTIDTAEEGMLSRVSEALLLLYYSL